MFWENIGNSLKQSNVHDSLITFCYSKLFLGKKFLSWHFYIKYGVKRLRNPLNYLEKVNRKGNLS